MTISKTASKAIGRGNGATTGFTYSFLIPSTNELQVTYIDASGNETVLGSSQFTVSGLNSEAGGTVTYPLAGSPIATGTALVIERILALQQTTELENQSGYFPAVVERALDRIVMMLQQLANGVRNYPLAMLFPASDVSPQTTIPNALTRAGKFLAFDGNGNPIALPATNLSGDLSAYSAKPTGGTSTRTLASRFTDYFTPMDFAGVGNGSADDTAALTAALAAGDVYLPAGKVFNITSTVSVAARRMIFGPGKLRMGAASISVLKLSVAGTIVQGISIDNPNSYSSVGTKSIGIEINANTCQVIGCAIDNVSQSIQVNTGVSDCVIADNVLTNCIGVTSELQGDGICIFGPRCTVVGNNVQCKAATDGRVGIVFDLAASYGVAMGNIVRGPWRRSIHVEASDYTVVIGNTLQGATQWGLYGLSVGLTFANNSVQTPAATTGPLGDAYGIYLYTCTDSKVVNNTVIGLGAKIGIYVIGTGVETNCTVEGNSITGAAGKLTLHGVIISGANGCRVRGNTITPGLCGTQGINVFDSARTVVEGNAVTGCGANGIIVQATSPGSIISGNVVRNNTGVGIQVNNSVRCTLNGNRCLDDGTGTQTYGIGLFNADDADAVGNQLRGNATAGMTITGTAVNTRTALNAGFNPVGFISAPSVPASTVAATNTNSYRVRCHISGGTTTVVTLNGTVTGLTSPCSLILEPQDALAVTYTAAPVWSWFGL